MANRSAEVSGVNENSGTPGEALSAGAQDVSQVGACLSGSVKPWLRSETPHRLGVVGGLSKQEIVEAYAGAALATALDQKDISKKHRNEGQEQLAQ